MAEINDLNVTDASNTARFPEGQAPSTLNNGGRALEGMVARGWKDSVEPSLDSTGSANAYVVAANRTLSAYYDGMVIAFHASFANTGAATLNVDSVGAKTIKKYHDEDLASGDISQHQVVVVAYSASDDTFQMLTPPPVTTDLVNDATPQLGGDLDVNGNDIVSASDGDINILPNGTGVTNFQDTIVKRPSFIDYGEKVNAIGSIGGGTQDIDLTLGNVVTGTVDTSETTFTFSNPPATGTMGGFIFIVTNGGSQTVNWPASVDWPGGSTPVLTTSGVDILTFVTVDGGTTWYGAVAGQAFG